MDSFSFRVGDAATTARVYRGVRGARPATLVLAHGAGAPQSHPWMVAMAEAVAARGVETVTFNFLYSERKRRLPDRGPVLEATWCAALDAARARLEVERLFIGGKSLGGRIATQIAARPDVDVAGLVLLGYPLHPPGKPRQLRTAHLPQVRAPMLFVQGSRDPFGGPEELRPLLEGMPEGTRLVAIEGGDHSLARRGAGLADLVAPVADEIARFIGSR